MDEAGEQNSLSMNDPYREIKDNTNAGLRPSLPGDEERKRNASAAENLRGAEESTSSQSSGSPLSGGQSDALSAEGGATFKNSVAGISERKTKTRFKFSAKKHGPIIALVALIGFLGILIFGSQTLMPFAIVNRFIEEFNTNGISSVLRSDNILDLQLSGGGLFGISEDQKSSLREVGIIPLTTSNGTTALAYKKGNEYNIVYGSTPTEDASKTAAINAAKTNFDNVGEAIFYSEALEDKDFKTPYTTASKTWRGGISGWFDMLSSLSESVHGYKKSRWYRYVADKVVDGIDTTFKDLAKVTLTEANGTITGGELQDDETTTDPETTVGGFDLAAKFTAAASSGANITCAAVEGFLSVQTLLHGYNLIQKLNLVSGFMEAVQKVQAGDGAKSPMNEYNKELVMTDPESGKNAMNSDGMGALFSGSKIDTSKDSVQSVNPEKAISRISESQDDKILALFAKVSGSASGLLKAYEICNYAKGTLAVANAAFTVASFIPIFGQALKIGQLTLKAVAKAVLKGIIKAAAPIIAKELVKLLGKTLVKDMATEWVGEHLGDALTSGANSLLSANHQTGGGSPGSTTKVGQFKQKQETVIAQEAEYQRSIRSPFDITSQYTFLGSLAYSLIPFATTTSVGGIISNISSLSINSVVKLLPTASAVAQTEMIGMAQPGDCPTLETIGIQGDAYCNPLYMTDDDTIEGTNVTPDDIIEQEIEWGFITINDDGSHTIKDNTELSNYIMYCGQRVSSWGIADANIANAINQKTTGQKILSMIPLVGDAMDVVDAATKQANLPWTTGSACVASESNSYWEHNAIHQRYVEDQRLLEGIGSVEKNAVTAFLEDYYDNNPLDNSYEGILARYSGMTKSDVIATLDFINGLLYIANYKPEDRLAFGKPEAEEIYFENTESVEESTFALEPKYIIYNDVRNRVFSV